MKSNNNNDNDYEDKGNNGNEDDYEDDNLSLIHI